MPRFDGTGPNGMGPMTGGRRGDCRARGLGRGRLGRFRDSAEEIEALEKYKEKFIDEIKRLEKDVKNGETV